MADILSDIYPIPVVFVDGQQPTAAFMNAWANQIDTAFAILGRILGDFDGESSEQGTFISNVNRTLGNIGWLNPRLPHNIISGTGDALDLPTLLENIGQYWEGEKDAVLTFVPNVSEGNTVDGNFDGDLVFGEDFTKHVPSGANNTQGLSLTDTWTVDGRRIYTTTPIPGEAIIRYTINPEGTETYESYHSTSGANVVPSLYEIATDLDLCVYTEPSPSSHLITLPYILRCMDPRVPLLLTGDGVIDLTPDDMVVGSNPSYLKWIDTARTPRYTIPDYIYQLALDNLEEENRIPDGLVSLWVKSGDRPTRVVNQNSEDQIAFYIIPGSKTTIEVVLPPALAGEMPHQIPEQEDLASKYIVAFAGISVAEAISNNHARALSHDHSGRDESSCIEFASLIKRFKPTEYSHSIIDFNLTPQYFLRSGYSEGSDPLNRDNAILGDVLIGADVATASNSVSPNNYEENSYKLYFGSKTEGSPALYFDVSDNGTAHGYGGETGNAGKLNLEGKILRVQNGIFLGNPGHVASIWMKSTMSDYLTIGREDAETSSGTTMEAGKFVSYDQEIWFGQFAAGKLRHILLGTEEDQYNDLLADELSDSVFLFGEDDNVEGSVIRAGQFRGEAIEVKGCRRTFDHTAQDYPTAYKVRLLPATSVWMGYPQPSYGLIFGLTPDSSPGRVFDPTNAEDTYARIIVPVPLQPSASAAGLGESTYATIFSASLNIENVDNHEGRYTVYLYKVDSSTLVRTNLYTSETPIVVPLETSDVHEIDLSGTLPTVELESEYLEFEIELQSGMGFMGGHILATSSHIG